MKTEEDPDPPTQFRSTFAALYHLPLSGLWRAKQASIRSPTTNALSCAAGYLCWPNFSEPLFHLPAWIARILIGDRPVAMMRDRRGISNGKATREIGWSACYSNGRDGFVSEFSEHKPSL
jgi:hypothetical protein